MAERNRLETLYDNINNYIQGAKNDIGIVTVNAYEDLFLNRDNAEISSKIRQNLLNYIDETRNRFIEWLINERRNSMLSYKDVKSLIEKYDKTIPSEQYIINVIEPIDIEHKENVKKAKKYRTDILVKETKLPRDLANMISEYQYPDYEQLDKEKRLREAQERKEAERLEDEEEEDEKEGSGKQSSRYELHAVIINKRLPIKEAERISRDFIQGNKHYYRETKNSYRFRNIPKQKFKNKTFRSKKINKDITLVYGELKPEFQHLKGAGWIGDLYQKAKNKYNQIKESIRVNPTLGYLGFNFCGPDTKLEGQKPSNRTDRICEKHDYAYSSVEKARIAGIDRATREAMTREADERMLNELANTTPEGFTEKIGHALSTLGIKGKVKLEDLGLLDRLKFSGGKRGRKKAGCYGKPCERKCQYI
jgi:hypothetical protein